MVNAEMTILGHRLQGVLEFKKTEKQKYRRNWEAKTNTEEIGGLQLAHNIK